MKQKKKSLRVFETQVFEYLTVWRAWKCWFTSIERNVRNGKISKRKMLSFCLLFTHNYLFYFYFTETRVPENLSSLASTPTQNVNSPLLCLRMNLNGEILLIEIRKMYKAQRLLNDFIQFHLNIYFHFSFYFMVNVRDCDAHHTAKLNDVRCALNRNNIFRI